MNIILWNIVCVLQKLGMPTGFEWHMGECILILIYFLISWPHYCASIGIKVIFTTTHLTVRLSMSKHVHTHRFRRTCMHTHRVEKQSFLPCNHHSLHLIWSRSGGHFSVCLLIDHGGQVACNGPSGLHLYIWLYDLTEASHLQCCPKEKDNIYNVNKRCSTVTHYWCVWVLLLSSQK